MAPLANEPRHVLTVLNHARRRALYALLIEITGFMRSQLEFKDAPSSSSTDHEFSLAIDPNAQGSSIIVPPSPTSSRSSQPSPELVRLRAAALQHFDAWRKEALTRLKDLLASQDDAKTLDERRKRTARLAERRKARTTPSSSGASLIDFDDLVPSTLESDEEAARKKAVVALQAHWHAIPTRLTTLEYEDRAEALSSVLLALLSSGHYTAESRALVVYLASALELPLEMVNNEEVEIAKAMVEGSAEAARQGQGRGQTRTNAGMSADREAERRKQQNQASRFLKVGLASVAGAAIIGVTGGLAAPVVAGAIGGIMGSVGLGGVASFLGIFWMNGALVGTLFGAFGARMTVRWFWIGDSVLQLTRFQGEMVDQYARDVEDFKFIPLKDEWGTGSRESEADRRRLRVTIGINGWLADRDDVTKPWRYLNDDSEVFALRYEMKSLLGLGESLQNLVNSYAWNTVKVEILKRTVLATLWSALWPAYLLSAASTIDNPFNLAKNRSEKAGEILADALINRVQGERPVTLVGYSLGARVIYSCLRSLARRQAFGLVENVVFIGAPVPSNRSHWYMMRSVVSGKLFNVYSKNDYLLAFCYRATSIQLGVAGLQEIKDIEGVENLNLSEEVQGHMRYAKLIEKILARCGLPVIKGVEPSIEKDEDAIVLDQDAITLEDLNRNKTSTLIDFEDLTISESTPKPHSQPPPLQHHPSESSITPKPTLIKPAQPQRTTITRSATNPLQPSSNLLDSSPPRENQNPPSPPTRMTRIGPSFQNPARGGQKPLARPSAQSSTSPTTNEDTHKFAYMPPSLQTHTQPNKTSSKSNDHALNNYKAAHGHNKNLPSYGTADGNPSTPTATTNSGPPSPGDSPGFGPGFPRNTNTFHRAKTFPSMAPTTDFNAAPTIENLPPPVSSHDNHRYDEPDDDDSDYGGIRMVDNDDLEYVEPRPMD